MTVGTFSTCEPRQLELRRTVIDSMRIR